MAKDLENIKINCVTDLQIDKFAGVILEALTEDIYSVCDGIVIGETNIANENVFCENSGLLKDIFVKPDKNLDIHLFNRYKAETITQLFCYL